MKISEFIQRNISSKICRNCSHFENDPSKIEEIFSGLNIMSSGFASVRDEDGICNHHQLYLSAKDHCNSFENKIEHVIEKRD